MIGIYQWPLDGGRPVALFDGNTIYDGRGNVPLARVEGNKVYRGQFMSGAQEFTVIGNHVHAGVAGAIVFTILGDSIGDGMGEPWFLRCPDGDKMALAGAAVAFIGELRLRQPGADVVPRSDYDLSTTGDRRSWEKSGVNPEYYGSGPDPFKGRRAPSHLSDKFNEPEYTDDANYNLRLEGEAPTLRDHRRHNSDDSDDSVDAADSYFDELDGRGLEENDYSGFEDTNHSGFSDHDDIPHSADPKTSPDALDLSKPYSQFSPETEEMISDALIKNKIPFTREMRYRFAPYIGPPQWEFEYKMKKAHERQAALEKKWERKAEIALAKQRREEAEQKGQVKQKGPKKKYILNRFDEYRESVFTMIRFVFISGLLFLPFLFNFFILSIYLSILALLWIVSTYFYFASLVVNEIYNRRKNKK